jgi:hypothetical protein
MYVTGQVQDEERDRQARRKKAQLKKEFFETYDTKMEEATALTAVNVDTYFDVMHQPTEKGKYILQTALGVRTRAVGALVSGH